MEVRDPFLGFNFLTRLGLPVDVENKSLPDLEVVLSVQGEATTINSIGILPPLPTFDMYPEIPEADPLGRASNNYQRATQVHSAQATHSGEVTANQG